ncbi:MAG: GTPase HflX, partial [Cyanobacteriota bacterium]
MKQTVLLGQTSGLRPAQQRRLERLSHRPQPEVGTADLLTLQRLAAESLELELPLTLVIDGRGLIRLLWVGPLAASGRLLERLPGSQRRLGQQFRLSTCNGGRRLLSPAGSEAIVGLDVSPRGWLRYPAAPDKGGHWLAALFVPGGQADSPWIETSQGELNELCEALIPGDAPALGSRRGGRGHPHEERETSDHVTAQVDRGRPSTPRERVVLLTLPPAERAAAGRD